MPQTTEQLKDRQKLLTEKHDRLLSEGMWSAARSVDETLQHVEAELERRGSL